MGTDAKRVTKRISPFTSPNSNYKQPDKKKKKTMGDIFRKAKAKGMEPRRMGVKIKYKDTNKANK